MKLENQVCSLDLAKKLKELGVKQDSFFVWEVAFGNITTLIYPNRCNCTHFDTQDVREYFAAFTVAELGELLPSGYEVCTRIIDTNVGVRRKDVYLRKLKGSTPIGDGIGRVVADTEADARTKMLIYLIKNKLISLP